MSNNSNDFEYKATKKGGGFLNHVIKFITIILLLLVIAAIIFLGIRFYNSSIKEANTENDLNENNDNNSSNNSTFSLEGFSKTSENVAESVLPSIVGIKVHYDVTTQFFGSDNFKAEASGSGIILTKDGYILTNNHIVSPDDSKSPLYKMSEAQSVKVTFNSTGSDEVEEADAKIIGVDSLTDLAVIKVDRNDLKPAKIGNSDNVKVGQFAMAIGSPLGLNSTVTAGIISAVNRKIDMGDGKSFTAIQTDASINQGNSGGALVNAQGEVIGINTLKFAGNGIEGIGFAIPINQTKPIAEEIIKNKKIERPSLGIYAEAVSDEVKSLLNIENGVIVREVIEGGSAADAGIQKNDIITMFNGVKVESVSDINDQKINLRNGDKVKTEIIRNNEKQEIEITMKLPKEEEKNKDKKGQENSKEPNKNERVIIEESPENIDDMLEEFFNF